MFTFNNHGVSIGVVKTGGFPMKATGPGRLDTLVIDDVDVTHGCGLNWKKSFEATQDEIWIDGELFSRFYKWHATGFTCQTMYMKTSSNVFSFN